MPSSGMLCHVALVSTLLWLLVTADIDSSLPVLTRATCRSIPEDGILPVTFFYKIGCTQKRNKLDNISYK
jgi:hypothetical protein